MSDEDQAHPQFHGEGTQSTSNPTEPGPVGGTSEPPPTDPYPSGAYPAYAAPGYPQYAPSGSDPYYQQPGYQQPAAAYGQDPYYQQQTAPYGPYGQPGAAASPGAADQQTPAPATPYPGDGIAPGNWPPAPAGGPRGGGAPKAIIAGVVAGLLAGLLAGIGGYAIAAKSGFVGGAGTTTQYEPTDPQKLSSRADNSVAAIAKVVLPATATIIVRSGNQGDSGSGFVIRSDGYLLTNNHVVSAAAGSGTVQVQFHNETPIPAKIVGRSLTYDLAVIKVDKGGLTAAQLGDSGSVVVGDAAIAIGSPLGLEGTVTSGIISSVNRPVTTGGQGEASYISALQTDAPINPGNSGGPLVNAEAQVVGVNSAIATLGNDSSGGQTGSIGLGFAIPINIAKRISDEIIATGKSTYPIIGATVEMGYQGEGAKITNVTGGGPAAAAGIKSGDVITAVNGNQISSAADLLSSIRAFPPGETITLTVQGSSGGAQQVKVKLGSQTS